MSGVNQSAINNILLATKAMYSNLSSVNSININVTTTKIDKLSPPTLLQVGIYLIHQPKTYSITFKLALFSFTKSRSM